MLGLTTAEVARSLAGTLRGAGDRRIGRVVTDSRAIAPGDLFVALPGARTDGHEFLRQAQQMGAAAAMVQPDRGLRPPDLPVVIVPDTLAALADLARFHLARVAPEVIGITGTVGKTTAKDFLAQLLGGEEAGVFAAPASFNSEIGLPLAVLSAPVSASRLVLEYGINAPGEMRHLLSIARPKHAWLTAIGPAHLEGLGDADGVLREKEGLMRAVPEGGRIWIPADLVERVADHAQTWAGRVRVVALEDELSGARVLSDVPMAWVLDVPRLGVLELPVVARHEALLAVTAARAALDLGVKPELIAERATSLVRPIGRLTVHSFDTIVVLDDSYNASPPSMVAGLDALMRWPDAGRRLAVLGTMHELGAAAEELHREVGAAAAACDLDYLVAVGRGGAWMAEAARKSGSRAEIHVVDDAEAARAHLERRVRHSDVVLLKASRAESLETLLPLFEAAGTFKPSEAKPVTDDQS